MTEKKRFDLGKLKENEFVKIGKIGDYILTLGIAEKNNRRSAQLRITRGITTIAKIRTKDDIETLKTFINNINKLETVINEIDRYNTSNRKNTIEFDDMIEL